MNKIYRMKVHGMGLVVAALFIVTGYLMVPSAAAKNPHFTTNNFTTIDFPNAGLTIANAVNKSGDIVGVYRLRTATGGLAAPRGFLQSNGQFYTIHVPGAALTRSFGINDAGDIVGDYLLGGVNYGFLLPAGSGSFQTIRYRERFFSSPSTDSWGIDNDGNVTGGFVDVFGNTKAYVWRNGVFTRVLEAPFQGTTVTYTHGMNAKGEIVGCYWLGTVPFQGTMHSLRILPDGTYVTENFPDSMGMSMHWRISDSSFIVGHYMDMDNMTHGYLFKNGEFETIDYPDAALTQARGIAEIEDFSSRDPRLWSRELLITGFYIDTSGATHGYLFRRRTNIFE